MEAEHHLIVAHEVTNFGNDRTQLLAIGQQARDVMTCEELTVLAYNLKRAINILGVGLC